nr:unnamed protein product [Naegleria fowleri]
MGSGLTKNSSSQQLRYSANSSMSSETAAWMNGARCPLRPSTLELVVQSQPCEGPPRFTSVSRKSLHSKHLETRDKEILDPEHLLLTCKDLQHSSEAASLHNEKATERMLNNPYETMVHHEDGGPFKRVSSLPVGSHAPNIDMRHHPTCAAESVLNGTYQKKLLSTFLENEPSEPEGCGVDNSHESNDTMVQLVLMVVGERWKTFMNTHTSKTNSQSITKKRPFIVAECSSSISASEQSSHRKSQYDERPLTPFLKETMEMKHVVLSAENTSGSSPPLSMETPRTSRQQKHREDNQQQVSTFSAETTLSPGNCIIISNHKSENTLVRTLSTKSLSKVVSSPIQVVPKDSPCRVRDSVQYLNSPTMKINHSHSALGFRSLLLPSIDKQMLEKVPFLTVTRSDEPLCFSHLPPCLRKKNECSSSVHKNRKYLDVL